MAATRPFLMPATVTPRLSNGPLDLKSVREDGVFEGYASLFHREDLGRDMMLPGAFANSVRQRGASGIKMLFQHDPAEPIGTWEEIREDGKGLFVRGRLTTAIAKARDVLELMRAGALDGLSIGFKAIRGRRDARSGIRRLQQVDLWEISVVTFPMLPDARVANVKQLAFAAGLPTERQFERWLTRDAGLTRMEARAVVRHGLPGLKALRDAGQGSIDDAEEVGRIRSLARRFREAAP
jgi:uncharacterized protein